MTETDKELVEQYLLFLQTRRVTDSTQPPGDLQFRRWDEMNDVVNNEPERAFVAAIALLERCEMEDLETIGINILEDLIHDQPEVFVQRFEAELECNQRFFTSFRSVRMGGVPLPIQRRLNRILIEGGVAEGTIFEFDPRRHDPDA